MSSNGNRRPCDEPGAGVVGVVAAAASAMGPHHEVTVVRHTHTTSHQAGGGCKKKAENGYGRVSKSIELNYIEKLNKFSFNQT